MAHRYLRVFSSCYHPKTAEEETIPLKSAHKTDYMASRWVFAVLGSVGFMIVYGLKVNLSVAIIAMVNHTAVAEASDHSPTSNLNNTGCEQKQGQEEQLEDGPFDWDENVQGLILASYFYGYILTQVVGGWVADKFSAKHVFGAGAFLNIGCTMFIPLAAKNSYMLVIALRTLMGIGGGVTLPAMHCLIAKWAPAHERSKITSLVYAGMTLGTMITMPLSGLLAAELGWESIFYVQGGLSIIWYVLWLAMVYDSPSLHPRISKTERQMIEISLGVSGTKNTKRPDFPLKKVFSSMPVWAIIVAHTCGNWGWYMLLVKLPSYMRYILKFDIKSNALISALPFLCMWFFAIGFAIMLDSLMSKKIITTTTARKMATFTASLPPAICLMLVTYVGCNNVLAVLFLTLATTFIGATWSGFLSNHIDIAPTFAGTLMGISNTFATVPGIVVPSVVGYITYNNQTVEAWRLIFTITLIIFSIECVFYLVFGSGEQQEWAKSKDSDDANDNQLKEGAQTKDRI